MTLRYIFKKDEFRSPPISSDVVAPFLHKSSIHLGYMKEIYEEVCRRKTAKIEEDAKKKESLFLCSDSVYRKDIYLPQTTIIEIRRHVLTWLKRYIVGRATPEFVP